MWRLILKFFFTHSFISYSSLKFLCLGSKLIQIIIFILSTLRGCSMRIQNTREKLSVNPIGRHQKRRILLADSQFGSFFIALATSWRRQVFLYVHSKNVSEIAQCAFKIWRELLYLIIQALRTTQKAFMMQVEQLPSYFECALSRLGCALSSSKRIQN